MPTETTIVVTAVVAVFTIYAAALARADYYTRRQPKTYDAP